jgi:hypothetical protein
MRVGSEVVDAVNNGKELVSETDKSDNTACNADACWIHCKGSYIEREKVKIDGKLGPGRG